MASGLVAPMRTDLGHQEDAVALAFESAAEPVLGFAAMVFPAVVEERDAAANGFVDDLRGDVLFVGIAQMMAAATDGGHFHAGLAKGPKRNVTRGAGHSMDDSPTSVV